jgi:pimeloyl-ACP methyl ester carboxylesterase
VLKYYFAAASLVAPSVVERQAAALFFTPRRRAKTGLPGDWQRMMIEDVAVWTAGSGPTVLLTHGWEGSAADFVPLATALVANGYRVALIDLPAHGTSKGRSTNIVECMRALSMVSHALGGVEIAVGHSFGAMATALAVAESRIAPRTVVLFAPVATPNQFIVPFSRMIGLPRARAGGVRREIEERVGRTVASFDVPSAVSNLDIPLLILHDPRDRIADWSYARAIADAWPKSRLSSSDGLGHRRLLSDPYTIARAVEFVRARATTAPAVQSP